MLKEKIKQLKRVLGAPVPDDNVIDSAGTEENPVTLEIDGVDHEVSSIEEIYATEEEKEQMNDEVDEGYLQYSAEVVGFENRELQWNAYRIATSYIDSNNVIDFGCGRGDFTAFWKSENPTDDLEYLGVDYNGTLIGVGNEIYPDINLIQSDWFELSEDVQGDWAINIGSCNLRYDADINTPDLAYTQKTITAMYNHCTRGVVVELASKYTSVEDDLINYDPGKMLNWAKEEFGNVAIDHSMGDDVFVLIIYKV